MFQDLGHGIRQARRDQQLYFAALLSEQTITDCFCRASQTCVPLSIIFAQVRC